MEYYFWLGDEAPQEAKSDLERFLAYEKNVSIEGQKRSEEHFDYPPVDYARE